jgi:hypothetical protein
MSMCSFTFIYYVNYERWREKDPNPYLDRHTSNFYPSSLLDREDCPIRLQRATKLHSTISSFMMRVKTYGTIQLFLVGRKLANAFLLVGPLVDLLFWINQLIASST